MRINATERWPVVLFGEEIRPRNQILHLTLHKKWFDKILIGRKRYEFRIAKPYWRRRLENRRYDFIEFRNGYSKQAPTMKVIFEGIQKRRIKQVEFYCIRLGNIIETRYLKEDQSVNQGIGKTEAGIN
jgi:hypothetical protein